MEKSVCEVTVITLRKFCCIKFLMSHLKKRFSVYSDFKHMYIFMHCTSTQKSQNKHCSPQHNKSYKFDIENKIRNVTNVCNTCIYK